nr:agamous-like MADS-box protein AGL61 [Ipomoea batatas]GME13052.1 agamous-like MADS-box protein AGL61 [Ipomoea batatas]
MMRGTGKKKIEIKKIEKESSRMVTFSKRRTGLFKKAVELEDKTGARVAIVVFSPRDIPYTYGDIPAMSDLLDKITNNNNAVVPYGGAQMQEDNAAVAATPSSNYENLMRWVDSIDVDGCNSLEEILKLKQILECLLHN